MATPVDTVQLQYWLFATSIPVNENYRIIKFHTFFVPALVVVLALLVAGFTVRIVKFGLRRIFPSCFFCGKTSFSGLKGFMPDVGGVFEWSCVHCMELNRFDAEFNPIDCVVPPENGTKASKKLTGFARSESVHSNSTNGSLILCEWCNEQEQRKLDLLSAFDPPNLSDELFAEAARQYALQLEKRFPLCGKCEVTVQRALHMCNRYVMTDNLAGVLHQSKAAVKSNQLYKTPWPLRRTRWYLMTAMRYFVHLIVYCWYAYLSIGEKRICRPESDISSHFMINAQKCFKTSPFSPCCDQIFAYSVICCSLLSIPASFYFPIRPPKNYSEEVRLKSSMRGVKSFFLIRFLLVIMRIASALLFLLRNVSFPVWPLAIADLSLLMTSRRCLTISPKAKILKEVGKRMNSHRLDIRISSANADVLSPSLNFFDDQTAAASCPKPTTTAPVFRHPILRTTTADTGLETLLGGVSLVDPNETYLTWGQSGSRVHTSSGLFLSIFFVAAAISVYFFGLERVISLEKHV